MGLNWDVRKGWFLIAALLVGLDYVPTNPAELDQFVERSELGYSCNICASFSHASRSNVRNHVESQHFPNTFVYTCDLCQKQCKSRQALQQHKSKICSKRNNKNLQFVDLNTAFD